MAQPEIGGVRTTEDESEKLETSSDDEEITIPSQDNAEIRNVDIRYEHSENTQREDWLLLTEPWHGARPRQTGVEHQPATKDSTLKNMADIFGTLRLSPGRQVDMKREDFHTSGGGGGGRQVPDPRGVQSEAQAMSKTVPEDTVSGKGQRKFKSPIEMLANTVAHMQRDGTGHDFTSSIFAGSHSKPWRPTICPRNGTDDLNRWHLVDFSCNP